MIKIENQLTEEGFLAGIVVARGISVQPSPQKQQEELLKLVNQRKNEAFPPDSLKLAVRNLLRAGGFKPSGRNKPASEYLAQAAKEDRFPVINNLVDINNYVSLHSGLPISLLDLDSTSEHLLFRCGTPGENYVFNDGGQDIDLQGLICACRADSESGRPLGNPVKDSMEGKIKTSTTSVIGVVYAPASAVSKEAMEELLSMFAGMLKEFGCCSSVETCLA
jgi:DNA/RNA-binding domain of Phe-tRNA-synthetase-like protein